MKRIKIFTWHIHGTYLYYLSQANIEIFIPKKNTSEEGYLGKTKNFPWPENVHEISIDKIKKSSFDCILFQSKKNYLIDQYKILSAAQRNLPKIYVEHDPPRVHPTDTLHVVNDSNTLLVHVSPFNDLMWDSQHTPTVVIDHGVMLAAMPIASLKKEKGVVVINNIATRGRRLGFDIFQKVKKVIPLDIVGIGSEAVGGLGEVSHDLLPTFLADYRFFFNPIRYTSMPLSLIEAMMVGLPIVAIASTELPTAIQNNISGFIDTRIESLIDGMKVLLSDKEKAKVLGKNAKAYAQKRFSIHRFTKDWETVFEYMAQRKNKQVIQYTNNPIYK